MSVFRRVGEDGMPVVLSHTVNPDSLQAEDFRVVTCVEHAYCHLRPAGDMDETDGLIGEFGNVMMIRQLRC